MNTALLMPLWPHKIQEVVYGHHPMGYSDPFNYLGSEGIGSGGYWDVDFRAHMT